MTYRNMLAITAVTLLGAACQETPTGPSADNALPVALDAVAKIRVCHFDETTGLFEPIDVSTNGNALERHMAHGDRLPDDPVPGTSGSFFDHDCVATAVTVLAIAYTDVDPNDGPGFKDGIDVLIAKLVDSNLDGLPSTGDEVITNAFPLDFDASAFGSFAVTHHVVSSVVFGGPTTAVMVDGGTALIAFESKPGEYDAYIEQVAAVGNTVLLTDGYDTSGVFGDVLYALAGAGPSQPDATVDLVRTADTRDDGFLDVEILYLPAS